ncbi:hypothetical protein BDZ45DRAFT_743702 [Acephala macrosclerotiorum]|nr:hypothetical protein BDZ45DRAFT_743702 [Acephala macrosclerotiorum]
MPFLRPYAALSSFSRQAPWSIRQPIAARYLSSTPLRFAQGYGDGESDPKGETPQHQGSSNQTKHNAEHLGLALPAEGQGTGAGPTKGGSGKTQEEASAQSGGSRSKDAKETGSSPTGGSLGGSEGKNSSPDSKNGASPKVHDQSEPGKDNSSDRQAEVEKHNRDFEQGHDRAQAAAEDRVDKKFWKGHGGADKDP